MILQGFETLINGHESKLSEMEEPLIEEDIEPALEALLALLNSNQGQPIEYARVLIEKSDQSHLRVGLAQGNGSDVLVTPALINSIIMNARITLMQELDMERADG